MLVLITLKPQFNEADPERYKAGFDGGVDFIATFDVVKPIHRNVCFYIQCKCHKEPLTKTAIRHTNVNRDKNIEKKREFCRNKENIKRIFQKSLFFSAGVLCIRKV